MDPALVDRLVRRRRRVQTLTAESGLSPWEAEVVARRERPFRQPYWEIAAALESDDVTVRDTCRRLAAGATGRSTVQ
jgi:hypothetical protein